MGKTAEGYISYHAEVSRTSLLRQRRRQFLIKTAGGALATSALAAFPRISWGAEPVNIGGLYPVTGSLAQIGQGCVAAAKLAVQMVNDAGGIKSLGGAKGLNASSSPTCKKRHDRHAHRDRAPDHRLQAVGDPRLLRQRADPDRERRWPSAQKCRF